MADEDKQFEATAAKLEQARKKGQVVKSKDLSTAISLLLMFLALKLSAPFIWTQISKVFVLVYEQIPNKHLEDIGIKYLMFLIILPTFMILVPILACAALVAIIGDLIQVGPLITTEPLMPKLDKLNPVNGFKNLFISVKMLFELFKNIVKVTLLCFVGFLVYKSHVPAILQLCANENTFSIVYEFGKMIMEFVFKAGLLFFVVAGADYAFTKWKFLKDQKMSFKEIKDEFKNSEGDPHVKAALKQRRMQMLQKKMLEAIPDADFVIINPIHIAVAIKYNAKKMRAPKVIAKGTELFAKTIIKIAREHNIPVIENPPVARALFRLVEINREIPPELYKAVAEILMFVYNLQRDRKNRV